MTTSFPSAIASELSALSAACTAASPLADASSSALTALAVQAANFATDVDAAISSAAGGLDAWTAGSSPKDMAAGVLSLFSAAQTQSGLVDLRGFAGRVASNLANR